MKAALICIFVVVGFGQNIGTYSQEYHIPVSYQTCNSTICTTQQGGVTLDENWRWIHQVGSATNCFTGASWNSALCPDPATCTNNCAIDGVPTSQWSSTYGITAVTGGIQMKLVTNGNVGSRVYLLQNLTTYKTFNLNNR